ncbi:hypothetical protein GE061_016790 [Apolygus lucorum]|uniref:Uncharacterized protein n=1 Tax=Apolygus lucorum TaxID=248454 RepID=A0A8S9XJT9_APOLU|nr:hypothetical protein GE061_016790 [Apolygus lucorum]
MAGQREMWDCFNNMDHVICHDINGATVCRSNPRICRDLEFMTGKLREMIDWDEDPPTDTGATIANAP